MQRPQPADMIVDLDKLEKKTKWSGFPRDKGVGIILSLIAEVRTLRQVVQTLTKSMADEKFHREDRVDPALSSKSPNCS